MIKFIKCPSVNYCARYDSIGCENCVTYKAYLIGVDVGTGEITHAHKEEEMNNDEKIKKIADHYGMESQIDILQEECAELVQAVSKYKRGCDKPVTSLLEEMADVTIMIDQVLYLLDSKYEASVYDAYFAFFDKKLDRQIKRIEEEG